MPPELETSYQVIEDRPDTASEEIAAITDLISAGDSNEPEPEQEAQPDEATAPPEMAEPDSSSPDEPLPEQDEAPEPEPGAIDYDMEVPMPDGAESVTIGQLKDHYQQHGELQQERDSWEDQRSQQQGELMATRQQLLDLANLMGDIKPEVVEHIQGMQAQEQEQQAALLLQVFPEWTDADKKAGARTRHLSTVKEYGFSEFEYGSINDHRIIRLLHDLTRYRERAQAGEARREQIKAELPKGQKTQSRKQTPAQQKAAMVKRAIGGTEQDKMAAISSLIKG
ncbi:MAG: hypothetical protein ACR2P6_04755 [Gammaproteobacteria bacterium]